MFRVEVATMAKPKTLLEKVGETAGALSQACGPSRLAFPASLKFCLSCPQQDLRPPLRFALKQGPSQLPAAKSRTTLELRHTQLHFPPPRDSTTVPVGCEFLADKSSGNLSDNVAPEKGAMDEADGLWIPVELGFLRVKIHIKLATLQTHPSANQHPQT